MNDQQRAAALRAAFRATPETAREMARVFAWAATLSPAVRAFVEQAAPAWLTEADPDSAQVSEDS